jgi:hypothetical protein
MFTYGPPNPTLALTNGALQVTLNAPSTTSVQYVGFGIGFNNCVNASAYTGVKFDIGGTVTGCALKLTCNFREDGINAKDPKGSCAGDSASCYPPQAAFTLTSSVVTTSVAFTSATGGSPVAAIDTTYLTTVEWQFTVPANATSNCVAIITVDNVAFY